MRKDEVAALNAQVGEFYRVLQKLGRGGMGVVYLAENLRLGRREALKVLRAELAQNPEFLTRFRREARAANRLQHRNIVGFYDFGQLPDGRLYFAMEHAEGMGVQELLDQGPLPLPRALNIMAQLSRAVAHAHERQVVHRDIKPSNLVLVEERGERDVLKVLDFGLAKITAPDYRETLGVSAGDVVYGTPAYMSPEQLVGEGADPLIDIYAMGCVACALLTGRPPYTGHPLDVAHAHLHHPIPRPAELNPKVKIPPLLDEIIIRCLEKDRKRRFQTGRQLDDALREVPGYPDLDTTRRKVMSAATLFRLEGSLAGATQYDAFGERTAVGEDRLQKRGEAHRLLRTLGETLVDAGCSELQLLIMLGNIADTEAERQRLLSNLDELATYDDRRRQESHEREGQLRFWLAELQFEKDQALARGARISPDVDRQIADLAGRLRQVTKQLNDGQNDLADRSREYVTALAETHEALDRLYGWLQQLIDDNAYTFAADPRVAALLVQLERERSS